ncbi:hypothetical protein H3S87_02605 [Bifidobacterium sp. W8108]|uniref:hypothetical protein n=1 Tax=Bifidobacterium TaxID=1678 RepID=UPI0004E5E928|nr:MULTISPECIES: hypothetical protein [Bifidobacterium]AII74987.1 putative phage protein [Bifidobacterium coryneforme]MBH9978558.1 hypothetical protein [Bifidobacterium sp. W8108]MBI0173572.1 hypothetical protein [Bifidobacterium sp. M0307]
MAQNQTGPDSQGNDLIRVGVPIGGYIAFAPYASENVIADDKLGKVPLELPEGYRKLGLIKADGAPQKGLEAGEATDLWQEGYSIPGDGKRSIQASLAENNTAVMKLTEGKEPDQNGIVYVDSGLPAAKVILLAVTKFRNGDEERLHGVAQVTAMEMDQETTGEPRGKSVTLEWRPDPLFKDKPYKQFGPQPPIESSAPEARQTGSSK